MIPVIHASIEWEKSNHPDGSLVDDVIVFDQRDAEAVNAAMAADRMSSSGACFLGWASGTDPCLTPEGVFASMIRRGFSSDDELLNALAQFAKIEGANWAKVMAASVAERLAAERGESD